MSCQCGDQARPAFDGETMKCTRCNRFWEEKVETPQPPEPTAQTIQYVQAQNKPQPNYYEDIEDPQLKQELDKVRARYNRKQRNTNNTKQELTLKAYGGWVLSAFLLATLIAVLTWR